jgi:hypothetical protein
VLQRADLIRQVTALDHKLYEKVVELVMNFQTEEELLKKEERVLVDCHVFARAIAFHIRELKAVDGYYIGFNSPGKEYSLTHTEHSWLMTPDGCIIEVYALGFLSVTPVLVPTSGKLTHAQAHAYKTDVKLARDVARKVMTLSAKTKLSITKKRLAKCL